MYPNTRKSNQRIFRVRARDECEKIRRVLGIDVFSNLVVAWWGRERRLLRRIRPLDLENRQDLLLRYEHFLRCPAAEALRARYYGDAVDPVTKAKAWDLVRRNSRDSLIPWIDFDKHASGCAACRRHLLRLESQCAKSLKRNPTYEDLYKWKQRRTPEGERHIHELVKSLMGCNIAGLPKIDAALARSLRTPTWRNKRFWSLVLAHINPCSQCRREFEMQYQLSLVDSERRTGSAAWSARHGKRNPRYKEEMLAWTNANRQGKIPSPYLIASRKRGKPVDIRIHELNGELLDYCPKLESEPLLFASLEVLFQVSDVWIGDAKHGHRKKTVPPLDHKPGDQQREKVRRLAVKAIAAALKMNQLRKSDPDDTRLIPDEKALERMVSDGCWKSFFPRVKMASRSSSPPRRS